MKHYHFSIVVERDKDGFFASCPQLQGCFSQGDTFEEVMANMKDVVSLHVEDRLADGEEIPSTDFVGVTHMDLAMKA